MKKFRDTPEPEIWDMMKTWYKHRRDSDADIEEDKEEFEKWLFDTFEDVHVISDLKRMASKFVDRLWSEDDCEYDTRMRDLRGSKRNFLTERVMQRAQVLREQHRDNFATYIEELSKLFLSVARNEHERKEAKAMLKTVKTFKRHGLWDE